MTHASVPENERSVLGISDTLIRLSVGLEDEADIIEDLDQALAAAVSIQNTTQQWASHIYLFYASFLYATQNRSDLSISRQE